MVYRGPLGATAAHAHHAVQAVVADTPVKVVDGAGCSIKSTTVVVPADHHHTIDGAGVSAVATYLDPALVLWDSDEVVAHPGLPSLEPIDDLRGAGRWAARTRAAIGAAPAPGPGDVVGSALIDIRRRLPDHIRLAEVAAAVGCSPSTLTHRFSSEVGIPMRRWVLWERLQIAARCVAAGASLTVAAHAAGFADSAHLNRTFRRMFGLAPSEVAGLVTWHVAALPDRSSA